MPLAFSGAAKLTMPPLSVTAPAGPLISVRVSVSPGPAAAVPTATVVPCATFSPTLVVSTTVGPAAVTRVPPKPSLLAVKFEAELRSVKTSVPPLPCTSKLVPVGGVGNDRFVAQAAQIDLVAGRQMSQRVGEALHACDGRVDLQCRGWAVEDDRAGAGRGACGKFQRTAVDRCAARVGVGRFQLQGAGAIERDPNAAFGVADKLT